MKVGILGINHKLADLRLREALARICLRRFEAGQSNHGDLHHFVLLSTCNRTEIYFSSEGVAQTHSYVLNILRQEIEQEFDQKLYSYFGSDCFLHLCRVISGLDSAIIGETEIQGQVKAAYESAKSYTSLPEPLHYLFQKALKVGKQVRSKVLMQRGWPDFGSAVFNAGEQFFSNLSHSEVLFIGASEINCKILTFFKAKNLKSITLCNRSLNRANMIAGIHGVEVIPWSALPTWHTFDWIICGTKAPGYLIESIPHSSFAKKKSKLIIDLSVPRNVDPCLGRTVGVRLLNIDTINPRLAEHQEKWENVVLQAEELVGKYSQKQVELKLQADMRRRHVIDLASFSSGIGQVASGTL